MALGEVIIDVFIEFFVEILFRGIICGVYRFLKKIFKHVKNWFNKI